MLVLSRKIGEEIVISDEINVRVVRVSRNRAFLAIEAPAKVSVDRQEIWLAKRRERLVAGGCESAKDTAGPEATKQSTSGCESGGTPATMDAAIVRRAIPMLNHAAGKDRSEENVVDRNDPHQLLQQGASLDGPPDASGLRAAVHRLIAANRACDGPEIEFWDDLAMTKGEFRPEFHSAVLSIVRELLLNVCRHSKSKSVLLGISDYDGYLLLQVQDWGIGFDCENAQSEERGLKGVRDLVAWLRGTLEVNSQRGQGTCVIVELPLLRQGDTREARGRHGRIKSSPGVWFGEM